MLTKKELSNFLYKDHHMKIAKRILLFSILAVSTSKLFTQQGPMNAEWFYGEHPFTAANQLHQNRQWKEAADEYNKYYTVIL